MGSTSLDLVILGLSITSSWGNGHATTYRALVRELCRRGHRVLFLERDVPWYAAHRDLPRPPYGTTELYASLDELKDRFSAAIRSADAVLIGSYVPDGIAVSEWVTHFAAATAFYDIDTPVTLARLEAGSCEYLSRELIGRFDLYLSFAGGPTLRRLEETYGARAAAPLYCSVDPELYAPRPGAVRYDLGYLGTYSDDRQPTLDRLLVEPARRWSEGRFVVAGPLYPKSLEWPANVERIEHLAPPDHAAFYCEQRFTLNVTRADMIRAGYSPSVRLFEAAACATPIVSDAWEGLETFFVPGEEILISRSPEETLRYLRDTPVDEARAVAARARERVLREHTADCRAETLEGYLVDLLESGAKGRNRGGTLESQLHHPVCATERKIAELGPWFHNVHLPGGIRTAPDHPLGDFPGLLWQRVAGHLPADLAGWEVLDVGCNAGFYSFELARRGARVTAIDCDRHYLRQAEWLRGLLGLEDRVEFRRMQVYDLVRTPETYDLVLFLGVFYHLRHPLLALDIVAEKARDLMLFQSLTMPDEGHGRRAPADFGLHERELLLEPGWPKMAFVEHALAGDPTNWWAPNPAAVEAMLRSSGFRVLAQPDDEIYLCRFDPATPRARLGVRRELLAAVGLAEEADRPAADRSAGPLANAAA